MKKSIPLFEFVFAAYRFSCNENERINDIGVESGKSKALIGQMEALRLDVIGGKPEFQDRKTSKAEC